MRQVRFDEVNDPHSYLCRRDAIRGEVLELKRARRIDLGEQLTLLFETTATVRYQIQEVVRLESHTTPAAIAEELDYYNRPLGRPGSLPATLLVQGRVPADFAWDELVPSLAIELANGQRVSARQLGAAEPASVHELVFPLQHLSCEPIALVCSHPLLRARVGLTTLQRAALLGDLLESLAVPDGLAVAG